MHQISPSNGTDEEKPRERERTVLQLNSTELVIVKFNILINKSWKGKGEKFIWIHYAKQHTVRAGNCSIPRKAKGEQYFSTLAPYSKHGTSEGTKCAQRSTLGAQRSTPYSHSHSQYSTVLSTTTGASKRERWSDFSLPLCLLSHLPQLTQSESQSELQLESTLLLQNAANKIQPSRTFILLLFSLFLTPNSLSLSLSQLFSRHLQRQTKTNQWQFNSLAIQTNSQLS